MALDVGKIIDGLKLSYGQLRNLLITSVGAVATVWIVGNKVGSMTTQMDTFNATLIEIKNELVLTRTETTAGLNRIYTDFTTINAANNDLWNNKFELLLEYGSEEKELLKKLLEYEDKRAAAVTEQVNTGKNYNPQIVVEKKNPQAQSSIKEARDLNGNVIMVPIDEYGNPIGDTVWSDSIKISVKPVK